MCGAQPEPLLGPHKPSKAFFTWSRVTDLGPFANEAVALSNGAVQEVMLGWEFSWPKKSWQVCEMVLGMRKFAPEFDGGEVLLLYPAREWLAELVALLAWAKPGTLARLKRVALVLLAWATAPWASESESESKRVSQAGVDSMVESEEE